IGSPTQHPAAFGQTAAVIARSPEGLPCAIEGNGHGRRAVAVVAFGAVAELAEPVFTPAIQGMVRIAGTGYRTGIDCAPVAARTHLSRLHGFSTGATFHGRGLIAPAIQRAAGRDGTGVA